MTAEERFEYIEKTMQGTMETLKVLAQAQSNLQEQLGSVVELVATQVEATNARFRHMEELFAAQAADAHERMKQMEENLNILIRAITSEHSNGKGTI